MRKTESHIDSVVSRKGEIKVDDLLSAVNKDIINALEKFDKSGETPPWNKPWTGTGTVVIMGGNRYPVTSVPHNICSPMVTYKFALNQIILQLLFCARGYKTNLWITHKRVKKMDAKIKKGVRPVHVFKFSDYAYMTQLLYNVEDVENYEKALGMTVYKPKRLERQSEFKRAKKYGNALKQQMKLKEGSEYACYSPSKDEVRMPHIQAFDNKANQNNKTKVDAEAHYWATFFHECIHWTGHPNRCHRFNESGEHLKPDSPKESSKNRRVHYAEEELVAELGAAYLCSYLNIQNELQHPEYIQNWIQALKKAGGSVDNHPIVVASNGATDAFKYIIKLVSRSKKKNK